MRLLILLFPFLLFSQSPEGYTSQVVETYNSPMATHFDGSNMYVIEREGKLYKDGLEVLDISNKVTTYFERGLLDFVKIDDWYYLLYTVEEDTLYDGANENDATVNRIERYHKDTLESEVVFEYPSLAGNHQGGTLVFDDEFLYVSTGDGANAGYMDRAILEGIISSDYADLSGKYLSQTYSSKLGKIISIKLSNFDWDVYVMGLRNPFRMSLHNGTFYIGDVGAGSWEMIKVAQVKGLNFGWGMKEGFSDISFSSNKINPDTGQPYVLNLPTSFDDLPLPDRWTTWKLPSLAYAHNNDTYLFPRFTNGLVDPIINQGVSGRIVIGGVILEDFGCDGCYVFADSFSGWLKLITPEFDQVIDFAEGFFSTVHITQHNGKLYVTSLQGDITEISYDGTLSLPEVEFNYMDANKTYWNVLGQSVTERYDGLKIIVYEYQGKFKTKKRW